MPDTGRPSKLTPAAKERVLQALGLGNTRAHAAAYAGIDAATLRRWMVRGRDETEGSHTEFRQAVLAAESRAQMMATGCIAKAIRDGNWKAAAWIDALDCNDDGELRLADPIYLINYLFKMGPQPPEPLDMPGLDPTPDGLSCL